MAKNFEGLHGIKVFAFDLIHIISTGATESMAKIEDEMDNENITNYIFSKYRDKVQVAYNEDCIYDLDYWNKELSNYSGYIRGREERKLGIVNENDGLLLLLASILELLNEPM